jgi:tyrosine-protein kinase Etk/Wzc
VSLVLPQWFTATTRMLPPQQGQSTAAAMLSQLGGGLGGLAGGALGIKNPTDLYVGMLRSDTVADALIARFDLKKVYGAELGVDARKAFREHARFAGDKAGIIAIEVEARDPRLAADLANGCVEELHRLTNTLAVTDAGQRRVFFERQLQQTKEKLADAEVKLRAAIDAGGLASVDAQSRGTVETVARLRAQISAKEIQIGAMRAYATASNPDMRRAEQELASMRQELGRLESGPQAGAEETSPKASASGVANVRLVREVKYQEVMFELLAKQYELARVDESKEAPLIQVLDRAAPPERRSSPRRALIVLVAFATAFFATAGVALFGGGPADAARRESLAALRAAWLGRRSR